MKNTTTNFVEGEFKTGQNLDVFCHGSGGKSMVNENKNDGISIIRR